eukprot:9434112-Pyramimonas_sp.AAC.1
MAHASQPLRRCGNNSMASRHHQQVCDNRRTALRTVTLLPPTHAYAILIAAQWSPSSRVAHRLDLRLEPP